MIQSPNILSANCDDIELMTHRSDRRRGYADNFRGPFEVVFIGWPPAREFHHGPEPYSSTPEAGDTGAVDQSFNLRP